MTKEITKAIKQGILETDRERLARPWQVRTMQGDYLTETFNSQGEAMDCMALKNKYAQEHDLRVRYRIVSK